MWTNDKIEKELRGTDFSKFSKVKGRLFNKLMDMGATQMSEGDLDMIVAAGNKGNTIPRFGNKKK